MIRYISNENEKHAGVCNIYVVVIRYKERFFLRDFNVLKNR